MHWFILIALWGVLNFAILEVVKGTYVNYDIVTAIFWISGVAFFIFGIYVENKKQKQKLDKENTRTEYENKKKQFLLEQYDLPIDCPTYQYLSGYNGIPNKSTVNVWVKENILNILSGDENKQRYQIPINSIKFYSIKGDMRQETETTGGDMTLGEMVVAEGLLGTAAAMKKNQVLQDTKTIDERKTIINATIEGENKFIFFEGAELYNYLLETIPGKEQSFVAMNK